LKERKKRKVTIRTIGDGDLVLIEIGDGGLVLIEIGDGGLVLISDLVGRWWRFWVGVEWWLVLNQR